MSTHTRPDGAKAEPLDGYAPPSERPPLLSYAALIALFNAICAALLILARRTGHGMPERVGSGDIVLIGTASHKLSRLISKDKVMAPLRAPFTELEGGGGPGELEESARGSGARRAVGDL